MDPVRRAKDPVGVALGAPARHAGAVQCGATPFAEQRRTMRLVGRLPGAGYL